MKMLVMFIVVISLFSCEKILDKSPLTDYDENEYDTIHIGNQVWMAENLKVTHYADGTPIPFVEDPVEWGELERMDKAFCWYDNSISNGDTYGALYTWAAANNGLSSSTANPSGVQGVCPTGWHLPSDAEWTTLTTFLDGENIAGGKMKETDTTYWQSPNAGATNESGFSALPGGVRYYPAGTFGAIGRTGSWWSATEYADYGAFARYISYGGVSIQRGGDYKEMGFSVRCIKD